MRRISSVLLCLFICALTGCQAESVFNSPVTDEATPWTHLQFRNDPADFQFAIVADRTGGHRAGVFGKACDRLNLLQPEFVICIGDLIEGGTADRALLASRRDEFDGLVDGLEMPFFYVPGNHDIGNPVMAETWRTRYGREYYHFVYKNTMFLCLCTEEPHNGQISDTQVEDVRKALAANRDVRWTLIFMHQPLYQGQHKQWQKIEAMLAGRPCTIFAGHWHTYSKMEKDGRKYFRLATTGGGSPLRGPQAGTFDHVVWVTMTDSGPRITNLMLNGIYGENVVKEAQSQAAK